METTKSNTKSDKRQGREGFFLPHAYKNPKKNLAGTISLCGGPDITIDSEYTFYLKIIIKSVVQNIYLGKHNEMVVCQSDPVMPEYV